MGQNKRKVNNAIATTKNDNKIKDVEIPDRMDCNHYSLRAELGKNFSAPVENLLKSGGAKVLNARCGTGIWTLEMATDFMKSKFYGIDTTDYFPTQVLPYNVKLEQIKDLSDKLPYKDEKFDYIYLRETIRYIENEDWCGNILSEAIRVLKNGGWIEICEPEMEVSDFGPNMKKYFDEISCVELKYGKWGGITGEYMAESFLDHMLEKKEYLKNTMGMSESETVKFIDDCRDELRSEEIRGKSKCIIIHARKQK
ncbi:15445_t:CDS:2 [Entrophospora sp. SA101]|nr:8141_t:CDS:2 [Entrophospora sp. SA101]CAJ0630109.1 9274_t:CDS:2 [Entrophospora sp. SA101]CAJ0748390.1 15445_t:CDS:2 [Entrophospora sp. SA101]CAJ0847728.1 13333_t:CDS:2 [Entrophospora sp. SA101]CAJ0853490.1 1612_t:CDS:2 [Entrophospora sp. SA101]